MSQALQVAVVGATGLIGQALLDLLATRQFPAQRVFAVDESQHEGETVAFGNLELDVQSIDDFSFENVGLAFFVAGSELSRQRVPEARAAGASVIDFSSAFRHDEQVAFVVPRINGASLAAQEDTSLVSVPNCTVTPLAVALNALAGHGLGRVTVSTYQSVSGSGQQALETLADQTTALFAQREVETAVYPKRIAFNLLPCIGEVAADGHSSEEQSVIDEVRRLLGVPSLPVEVTCVRVPVFFGHAWAVHVALDKPLEVDRARKLLAASGIHVVDEPQREDGYATPMEVAGSDRIWVSRVRATPAGLAFWLTADNVRVGAALNCVEVAEVLLKAGKLN
ncbi:aspartate-semialdehyde dehydrogenase [Paludibacterium sp. B53371]|uniref:aspartate-semialdehyde dehydrogenase n=1 Tax=Paludibacterium sp. B53371 TaxID=2806263 RepID=UPI001C04B10A|nr:aspartate-semialdehyde dehydrogenase [Paludibacterium sp. B53371]